MHHDSSDVRTEDLLKVKPDSRRREGAPREFEIDPLPGGQKDELDGHPSYRPDPNDEVD